MNERTNFLKKKGRRNVWKATEVGRETSEYFIIKFIRTEQLILSTLEFFILPLVSSKRLFFARTRTSTTINII